MERFSDFGAMQGWFQQPDTMLAAAGDMADTLAAAHRRQSAEELDFPLFR